MILTTSLTVDGGRPAVYQVEVGDAGAGKMSTRLQVPAILLGLVCSLATAKPVVAIAVFAAACVGYAACERPRWLTAQRCLAWFIGGFATGAGVVLLAILDQRHRAAIGWVCLLSVWVATAVLFRLLERAFSLVPRAPPEEPDQRPRPQLAPLRADKPHTPRGRSAWTDDGEGPVGNSGLTWQFSCRGEIAMGGPTFGTLEISNGITLESVGPSIAFSSDGELGAVTIPSRDEWRLMLISVREREIRLVFPCHLWEIDELDRTSVYGRHSPLVSNRAYRIAIEDIMRLPVSRLVERDGRWREG